MKKTKIVCTIGPATDSYESICKLINLGMDVARLNMSHGNLDSHGKTLGEVKRARKDLNKPCAIMVDTCGPEIRIKNFKDNKVTLEKNQLFTFCVDEVEGDSTKVSCPYPQLMQVVKPRQKIFANNGLLEFKVMRVENNQIICKVIVGGDLSNHKSISIPRVRLNLPFISQKDEQNIKFACENDVEFISASFVNTPQDVAQMRDCIKKYNGRCQIISKIESFEGIKNLDSIIELSDGIMVARGDLGTEIPIERIPFYQKMMISKTVQTGKRVIVATEMLESMITKRRPTRAETTDVAQAIYDKTSATMLSGETASGDYPFEAVSTMAKIITATEGVINYDKSFSQNFDFSKSMSNAISYSACLTARSLGAKVVVCFTDNGKTARMISRFRPSAKILAIAHDAHTYNSLTLSWGVTPVVVKTAVNFDEMQEVARKTILELKLLRRGEKFVMTVGLPAEEHGPTNCIKVCEV